jgi:PAS domain S-box-containing protein
MPAWPPDRERLRSILDTILEAAQSTDLGVSVSVDDGSGLKFLWVNDATAAINGEPAEELIGTSPTRFAAPEDLAKLAEMRAERMRGPVIPQRVELTVVRRDGTRVPVEAGVAYAPFEGRTAAVVFMQDISARKKMMEALTASEARFRQLIERAPDAIAVSRGGRWIYVNPAMVSLLGLRGAADIVGRTLFDLVHPDDHPQLRSRLDSAARGNPGAPIEYRVVRPDGEVLTLELTSMTIDFEGSPALLGFARDVTRRNQVRAQLIEADRLAAMGTLAAGVGHEINNPLAYVLLNLQALERDLAHLVPAGRLPEALHMVENAISGVDRVRAIVRDLKMLSRADTDAQSTVDVRRVMDTTLHIASVELRHRARVVTRFDDVPPVRANEARLGQVLLNLLMNAAQALPEGRVGDNEIRVSLRRAEDGQVVIEVADSGPGIPEHVLPHIFEPFYTTKPVGVGTGLGLSICRSIVTRLGGEIVATNAPGGGAVVRVTLPSAQDASEPARGAGEPRRPRRPLRLLVVEDEADLARALVIALGRLGHTVVVALSGSAALEHLVHDRVRNPDFDVVLCDLMLPGLSGVELYEAVRRRVPELARRFVFMTGADTSPVREFLARVDAPSIEKPFQAEELLEVIARLS